MQQKNGRKKERKKSTSYTHRDECIGFLLTELSIKDVRHTQVQTVVRKNKEKTDDIQIYTNKCVLTVYYVYILVVM